MNVEEKERLIKKDIRSIENRVRSAFNQGYEMGLKEDKEQSGDAISRKDIEECKELMTDINGVTVFAVKMSDIRVLPTVTPQPKMGRWMKHNTGHWVYYDCSLCGCVAPHTETVNNIFWKLANYCPDCGAKMECGNAT